MAEEAAIAGFVELEDQWARLSESRVNAVLANDDLIRSLEKHVRNGDPLKAYQTIQSADLPPVTGRQRLQFNMLARTMVRLGANTVHARQAARWLRPSAPQTRLLTAAIEQHLELERIYLLPVVAETLRNAVSAEIEALTVQKAEDLIPEDFGYQPVLEAPAWKRTLAAGKGAVNPATLFAANLTTSRLVNYGALDAMRAEKVVEYRLKAKLDRKTSDICRNLNGKKFRVEEGLNMLERALMVRDPNELRHLHPWIPGTKAALEVLRRGEVAELRAKGWMVPPFHPRCRTVVVRARSKITTPPPPAVFNPTTSSIDLGPVTLLPEVTGTPGLPPPSIASGLAAGASELALMTTDALKELLKALNKLLAVNETAAVLAQKAAVEAELKARDIIG